MPHLPTSMRIVIASALGLFLPALSFAATTINVDYVEKSVVFLYATNATGDRQPLGTGFIVLVPVTTQPGRAYKILVTARHMVDPQWAGCPVQGTPNIFLRLNKKVFDPAKDVTGIEDLDVTGEIGVSKAWIFADDPEVDAAILLLNGSVVDRYDVAGVRISDFPTSEETKTLKAGDDVVSAGLLPGASGKKRNYPIFKFGNISSIPGESADASCGTPGAQSHFMKLWFVAANLAPGNSGSPIYYAPRFYSGERGFLLGIQSTSYIPWDVAGMTPIEYVYEMIEKLNLKDADLRRNIPPDQQKPQQPKPEEPKKDK